MSQELLWLWSPVLVAISTTECLKRYLMAQVTILSSAVEYVRLSCPVACIFTIASCPDLKQVMAERNNLDEFPSSPEIDFDKLASGP